MKSVKNEIAFHVTVTLYPHASVQLLERRTLLDTIRRKVYASIKIPIQDALPNINRSM